MTGLLVLRCIIVDRLAITWFGAISSIRKRTKSYDDALVPDVEDVRAIGAARMIGVEVEVGRTPEPSSGFLFVRNIHLSYSGFAGAKTVSNDSSGLSMLIFHTTTAIASTNYEKPFSYYNAMKPTCMKITRLSD